MNNTHPLCECSIVFRQSRILNLVIFFPTVLNLFVSSTVCQNIEKKIKIKKERKKEKKRKEKREKGNSGKGGGDVHYLHFCQKMNCAASIL